MDGAAIAGDELDGIGAEGAHGRFGDEAGGGGIFPVGQVSRIEEDLDLG